MEPEELCSDVASCNSGCLLLRGQQDIPRSETASAEVLARDAGCAEELFKSFYFQSRQTPGFQVRDDQRQDPGFQCF